MTDLPNPPRKPSPEHSERSKRPWAKPQVKLVTLHSVETGTLKQTDSHEGSDTGHAGYFIS